MMIILQWLKVVSERKSAFDGLTPEIVASILTPLMYGTAAPTLSIICCQFLVVASVTVALTSPVTNDLGIKLNIGGSEVIAIRFFSLVFLLPFENCDF